MASNSENDSNKAEQFNLFWEASTYSPFNIKEFAAAQEEFSSKQKAQAFLEYPVNLAKLPLPKTTVNKLAKKRQSQRTFTNKPLSQTELGQLLSSFYAFNGLEHRSFPSAGASYATEIFCLVNSVTGLDKGIYYYNADLHTLSPVAKAPSWKEATKKINVVTEDVPQLVIFFVLFTDRLTEKYLERGGRFALIEVGSALQQLSLQIAGSKKLTGVAAGGVVDDYWLKKLNLDPIEAKIALGFLCGK